MDAPIHVVNAKPIPQREKGAIETQVAGSLARGTTLQTCSQVFGIGAEIEKAGHLR